MKPDYTYAGYVVPAATSMAFAWDDQTAHRSPGTPPPANEHCHCLWAELEPEPKAG